MVKFIHTSDWQLGITRRFLTQGAQERFSQARFDCVKKIGGLATELGCGFVVVCGDIFESNQVGRDTIAKTLEAVALAGIPFYLLPGNHDPLDEASVYRNAAFQRHKPDNVVVVADSSPIRIGSDTEIVGAPWRTKQPAANPLHAVLAGLAPAGATMRICLGHGAVDALLNHPDGEAVISYERMRAALAEKKVHFIALGDRHSSTRVDAGGRIWFSGTPEATAFRETVPGFVNVVTLEQDRVETELVKTGTWTFVEREAALSGAEDVALLAADLRALPNKETCVAKLSVSGFLDMAATEALEAEIEHLRDLFAALETNNAGLRLALGDDDLGDGRFTGFAKDAVAILMEKSKQEDDESRTARDALLLLLRLDDAARRERP